MHFSHYPKIGVISHTTHFAKKVILYRFQERDNALHHVQHVHKTLQNLIL